MMRFNKNNTQFKLITFISSLTGKVIALEKLLLGIILCVKFSIIFFIIYISEFLLAGSTFR